MNRKILIGAAIVTFLIIVVGGYFALKSGPTQTPTPHSSGSPFGEGGEGTGFINTENPFVLGPNQTEAEIVDRNGLQQISSAPVSGAVFVSGPATTASPSIRFVERATGHIFEADLETDTVVRASNTTIPRIERGFWGDDETFFAQRSEDNGVRGEILSLVSVSTSTATETKRNFLPDNILEASFSPSVSRLFYLAEGISGVEGYLWNVSENTPSLIWNHPISSWVPQWFSDSTVSLTTKASNGIPGILYFLNTQNGAQTRILGDMPGLTTLVSPSGSKILYSSSEGVNTSLYIYDRDTQTTRELLLSTVPEKCVWERGEFFVYCAQPRTLGRNFPDSWYQGLTTLEDDLWRIRVETGEKEHLSDLNPDPDTFFDVIDPHLSAQGDFFLFTNKKDLSLWAVPLR